jgi:LysR family glycine cleavage system transcriptional activator
MEDKRRKKRLFGSLSMSISHDGQRLPPLRALRVFEAAARHESLTGAARELGVTQSAVSRQVAALEGWLGRPLFRRSGPRLRLTDAGTRLGSRLAPLLREIGAAVSEARARPATPTVTLSMLPSVAARWLAPRLGAFLAHHPGVDLRITASRHLVDFAAEGVDAAIRYGAGHWPGCDAVFLGGETVFPVLAPGLAARLDLKAPADLLRAPLIHSDLAEDWQAWFAAAGVTQADPPRGPYLEDDSAALQAVLDGQGVALGRSRLIGRDLAAGLMVAPFAVRLTASYAYYFVAPPETLDNPTVQLVRDWLVEEFRREADPPQSTAP